MSAKTTEFGFEHLAAQVEAQDGRISAIERGLTDLTHEVRGLVRAVTVQAAQPQFKVQDVVSLVRDVATLAVIGAGAIIWIATSISSAPLARYDEKFMVLSKQIERLERAK